MQSLVRSAAAVRHARRFLAAIEPITLREPLEARRGIFSGFGSPWWTESGRTFCCGPHHIGDLRSVTGDSNVLEDGHFAGTVKKETLTTNNKKKKKKKKADDAALFRSFEQWMAEYGKVYPTEAEKARRFKYFKETVVHGGLELYEFTADSPKEKQKKKKEADDAALFRLFEQWMAEYGKVYPTEAEKARRFKYFKETVVHGGLELYEFTADSPKEKQKKKKEADDAALFRLFEQWMAEYGKVYRTEAEKARRFKYFKDTVGYDEFAADSPKERSWPGQHQEYYISLSRLDRRFFG